jgi:pimeloyl-ACP methyl ester carboxylesterase
MANSVQEEEQLGKDPDFDKSFQEIVAENNYLFEQHSVTTDDGYILNVFRIKKQASVPAGTPVVFLQHGITDSADCWIVHYPDVAPAFRMVEAGYDVWLGNQRGTKYSLGHTHWDSKKDKEYWEFSFSEMGKFDAPAQVDYVRASTGAQKLAYVGHSQGTAQMFYALATNQDFWAQRLTLFASLAPITRIDHTTNKIFGALAQDVNLFASALDLAHVYSVLGPISNWGTKIACSVLPQLCQFAEGFLITQDPSLDDSDRFQVYMGHFPSGASVHSFVHFGQVIKAKKFQDFDWGQKRNQQIYGQDSPPEIDISKITDVPLAMFVGSVDDLGDPIDCRWARDQINAGGSALKYYEEVPGGHSSFMVGKNMTYLDTLIGLMDQHQQKGVLAQLWSRFV